MLMRHYKDFFNFGNSVPNIVISCGFSLNCR